MNNQGKQSNYNYPKGDIINQSGNFQTGVDKRKTRMEWEITSIPKLIILKT